MKRFGEKETKREGKFYSFWGENRFSRVSKKRKYILANCGSKIGTRTIERRIHEVFLGIKLDLKAIELLISKVKQGGTANHQQIVLYHK